MGFILRSMYFYIFLVREIYIMNGFIHPLIILLVLEKV